MTPDELKQLYEAHLKADNALWQYHDRYIRDSRGRDLGKVYGKSGKFAVDENGQLITLARNSLPKLLDYISTLLKELVEAKKQIDDLKYLEAYAIQRQIRAEIVQEITNSQSSREELWVEVCRLRDKLQLVDELATESEKLGQTSYPEHKQRVTELLQRMRVET